ncbi:phosphopantetheine-binding protein, partial [Streptomyces cinnamoneus]
VAWGPWAGAGMAAGEIEQRARRGGLTALTPEPAVAALHRAVTHGDVAVVVADVDWEKFAAARHTALLGDIPEVRRMREQAAPVDAAPQEDASALLHRLAQLPESERSAALVELVCGHAAAVLGYANSAAIDPGRTFGELGCDSLTAVELRNQLTAATGLPLSASLVFDYPTPLVLAEALAAEVVGGAGTDGASVGFAELEKLEGALVGGVSDEVARNRLAERLQALVARLTGADEDPAGESRAAKFAEASDDELFDFIHRELGR